MNVLKYIVRELVTFVLLALLIVVPFRLFIAQPFVVQGASMYPTFETGQYIIIDQLSYRFGEPERGDVITFKYPEDPSVFFIKRIIGLPGEKITVDGDVVTITQPGVGTFVLTEPYANFDGPSFGRQTYELGEDEYFVMGDNRPKSSDSRLWGPLPEENIMGKAFFRLLPPTEIGGLGNI